MVRYRQDRNWQVGEPPVERDLSGVGQNLQDHLQARPIFKTNLSTINTEIKSWAKRP